MAARSHPQLPVPKTWRRSVKSAVLHIISLAQFSIAYTRGWAANCPNARIRLAAENERLKAELAWRAVQTADRLKGPLVNLRAEHPHARIDVMILMRMAGRAQA
jgi:hypothetical protein